MQCVARHSLRWWPSGATPSDPNSNYEQTNDMSEITPELAPEVVAACQAGSDEAASELSRSLDTELTLTVGEIGSYSREAAPEGFDGAGLAVLMKFGDVGVTALLPEASDLLPDWYADPDPTGASKLSTLAQELSMLLVPETLLAEDFKAARVESLSEALASAGVSEDAALVPLELVAGANTAQLSLIWPVAMPDRLLGEVKQEETPVAAPPAATPAAPANAENQSVQNFSQLPGYSRSLLKIDLPVQVVLATKKESLKDVVELASGSIIKFDKACDEMLHLCVGDQQVAVGEAVKIGDKFGFRVSQIVMPDENFTKVQPRKKADEFLRG